MSNNAKDMSSQLAEKPPTHENDDEVPPLLEEEPVSTSNSSSRTYFIKSNDNDNADTQSVTSTQTYFINDTSEDSPMVNNSDTDGSDDDSLDEMESETSENTKCLFCAKVSNSIEPAIAHLRDEHKVDLSELKKKHCMDQYSYIKLINYIRTENLEVEKLLAAQQVFWSDEKYLKPVEYEPWLSYDFDHLQVAAGGTDMLDTLALANQVQQQTMLLKMANDDMIKMRQAFEILMKKAAEDNEKEPKVKNANKPLEFDREYFSSYSHFGIHHEMLSDVVRTTSYRDALLKNKDFVQGKTVLDVGCGTSVLSIFASKAGASKVVGIDNSDILYNAMSILKRNKVENISLIKGRLEDTDLPIEKYDIIISEWMGYFLLFEGMLDSIIYARQRHLKEGGIILPNRCTLSILGYGSDELYARHISFWDNVYDIDMSNMRKDVLREPLIDIIDPTHILTEPEIIADLNMATVELDYSTITHSYQMKFTKSGNLSAFVGYFDTYFDLPTPVSFGTSPTDTPTHWKQVAFFIDPPHAVQANEVVNVKFICRRLKSNARSLDIVINVFGKDHSYYLD